MKEEEIPDSIYMQASRVKVWICQEPKKNMKLSHHLIKNLTEMHLCHFNSLHFLRPESDNYQVTGFPAAYLKKLGEN